MLLRFAAAIALLTAIGLAVIGVQKQNLDLKRTISQQQYEIERLREEEARLRLEVQRLQTPERLLELHNGASNR